MMYRRASWFSSQGFTLVELLIYMAIFAVVGSMVLTFFTLSVRARIKNQTINEVEQQGQWAMNLITQTIRNAQAITSPASGASGASASLTTYSSGTTPTVFSASGTTLQMAEGTGSAVPLTSSRVSVGALTFQNAGQSGTRGLIRVQFTVSMVNNNKSNEYEFSKIFYGSAAIRASIP